MSFFSKLWDKVKVKVVVAAVTVILESARAYFGENVPLPPTDVLVTLAVSLMGFHTLTDVVNIIREAIVAWANANKGNAT